MDTSISLSVNSEQELNQPNFPIKSGDIIYLQHEVTRRYLMTCNIKYSKGSKNMMVGGTPLFSDPKCAWEIHIQQPKRAIKIKEFQKHLYTQKEIWFGDIISLKNKETSAHLSAQIKYESQTTTQGEMSCVAKLESELGVDELFMVGFSDSMFPDSYPVLFEPRLRSGSKIRLININTYRSVHSHKHFLTQKEISEYHEITAFGRRDDNDNWFVWIHPSNQKKENTPVLQIPMQVRRNLQKIRHKDLFILRNIETGACLSSNESKYKKGSKKQQVSCRLTLPRNEEFDFWELVIYRKNEITQNSSSMTSSISQLSTYFNPKSSFALLHKKTNSLLTNLNNQIFPYELGGLEVCCTDDAKMIPDEWQIMTVNENQENLLYVNEPFIIRHQPSGYYLSGSNLLASPCKENFQVSLQQKSTNYSVWIVEQIISEYDD